MATFDATLSGANATSYVSVERATDLVTDTPQEATWTAMSESEQKSSLNVATMWLETLKYGGSRCGIPSSDDPDKPQALKWPRSGVTCEGLDAICELIPYRIEWAQVLLRLWARGLCVRGFCRLVGRMSPYPTEAPVTTQNHLI